MERWRRLLLSWLALCIVVSSASAACEHASPFVAALVNKTRSFRVLLQMHLLFLELPDTPDGRLQRDWP